MRRDYNMDQKKIGIFIASLRKEKGYTQNQIAEMMGISEKTISKWECGNGLPEVSLMLPLCDLLGISVNELLLGERLPLLDMMAKMGNTMDELVKQVEYAQLKYRIYKQYGLDITEINESKFGAGSITYFIKTDRGSYVVKYFTENSMNHPENEFRLCSFLLQKGIPVSTIVKNCMGNDISVDENGRRYHVQESIEGIAYDYHQAPKWLMEDSAKLLGKIHTVLMEYPPLSEGIDKQFFQNRTIQDTLQAYEKTLNQANENGDVQIALRIKSNMDILEKMPIYSFDMDKFTYANTHGDFIITQLICGTEQINGCIDWTTSCRHPVVWEIIRSYVYASPKCCEGKIDIEDFISYVKIYLNYAKLNAYDLENMGKMFFQFCAVCNFYGQYYSSQTKNRSIFLKQADLSSKLLEWFLENVENLTKKLVQLDLEDKKKEMEEKYQKKVDNFYDENGKLVQYPSKRPMRMIALRKIALHFEVNRTYTEKEVNNIIKNCILFTDIELIRREMIEHGFMNRLRDGSQYWLEK